VTGHGGETTLEEVVDDLLRHADPERDVYPKLVAIRDSLRRGAFLGPSARAFIDRLQARLRENIECRGLSSAGLCTIIPQKGQCDCVARFRRCVAYEPVRPLRRSARSM
jgi:hypothetical protein